MAEQTTAAVTCSGCAKQAAAKQAKRGGVKMPRGRGGFWRRIADAVYCPDCFKLLYRLRAATLPARGEPLDGGTTDELWAALRAAWDECRMLCNWATTELAKLDRPRRPGESLEGKTFKQAAPPPRPYLYPAAVALFPALPSQAITAMLQGVRTGQLPLGDATSAGEKPEQQQVHRIPRAKEDDSRMGRDHGRISIRHSQPYF